MRISLTVAKGRDKFSSHIRAWQSCTKCEIGKIAQHHVFYRGTIPCDVLFVGLAPGRTENVVGEPFVGKSGHLLERWIKESLNEQAKICIANLVCCRPCDGPASGNRDPSGEEIRNCRPRLQYFINLLAHPSAIVTVGKLVETSLPAGEIPILAIKHPSYALRIGAGADIRKDRCEHPTSVAQIKLLKEFYARLTKTRQYD